MNIKKGTIFCLSLGCAKNRVDSERIIGGLKDAGFEITTEPSGAETCIVNTCGFLRTAVEEGIDSILSLAALKDKGDILRIGVVGCMVNRYGDDLKNNLPEVDFWARCEDYASIISSAGGFCKIPEHPKRFSLPESSPHTRYLKLSEGCNNRCTYCAIPAIRGDSVSFPVNFLVEEANQLVHEGAREICLVAQDLTAYRSGNDGLQELLDALESSLPSDVWLRLLYLHPRGVNRRFFERIANSRQIVPYLDMPIQHASGSILKSMNREISDGALLELFRTAREIRSDFALRTTCMVGFPGESRMDFDILMRFLDDVQFDRVGAFMFSPEEGTEAATMPKQVTDKTKRSRLERLMSLQEEISLTRQNLFKGRELKVIIDSLFDGIAEGRSFREAPEVDGVIEISDVRDDLHPGDIITAHIIETYEHDMIAVEVI